MCVCVLVCVGKSRSTCRAKSLDLMETVAGPRHEAPHLPHLAAPLIAIKFQFQFESKLQFQFPFQFLAIGHKVFHWPNPI